MIVHIASGRSAIRFRAEAGQTFFMDVDAHRADSVDQNVDAQIVLQIVDQVRGVDIVLDHPSINTFVLLRRLDIFQELSEVLDIAGHVVLMLLRGSCGEPDHAGASTQAAVWPPRH